LVEEMVDSKPSVVQCEEDQVPYHIQNCQSTNAKWGPDDPTLWCIISRVGTCRDRHCSNTNCPFLHNSDFKEFVIMTITNTENMIRRMRNKINKLRSGAMLRGFRYYVNPFSRKQIQILDEKYVPIPSQYPLFLENSLIKNCVINNKDNKKVPLVKARTIRKMTIQNAMKTNKLNLMVKSDNTEGDE
jgi:hypothetical protein